MATVKVKGKKIKVKGKKKGPIPDTGSGSQPGKK